MGYAAQLVEVQMLSEVLVRLHQLSVQQFRERKINYYLAMGAHGSPAEGYKILYAN